MTSRWPRASRTETSGVESAGTLALESPASAVTKTVLDVFVPHPRSFIAQAKRTDIFLLGHVHCYHHTYGRELWVEAAL